MKKSFLILWNIALLIFVISLDSFGENQLDSIGLPGDIHAIAIDPRRLDKIYAWTHGEALDIRQVTETANIFSDVPSDYWAYDYIIDIYDAGITTGCAQDDPNTPENERRYCPEDSVTRGQMAAFIIRAKYGENFSYTTTPYFTDVPSTHTFFKYVQKLRDDGITAVSGTYAVDSYVTRGQMAAFIIRAKFGENFSYTLTPYFTDVLATHNFFKYVQKLKDEGITAVTGTYGVDNIITRAQMAAFLSRAFLITAEASATIGPSGGLVEVTNPSSPLYGVKVEIPAGALNTNTNITISIQNVEPTFPTYLKKASAMVLFSPEGTSFNVPVTISIPYNSIDVTEKNMLGVYTYDREASAWNILTLKDMGSEVIKALTQHFSPLQVSEYTEPLSNSGSLNFTPSINGFSLDNFGDDSDPGGHCWGMVAFAGWYWQYKHSDANLSVKYSDCKARSVINETNHKIAEIRDNLHQDAAYVANALMMGIDLEKPQFVSLFIDNPPGHAVLVYKYVKNSDSSVIFYIYDPNYPTNDNIPITYRNGAFEPYGSYNEYRFVGGLYSLSSYETIYNLVMMPKIENTSPTGNISSKRPTISATIKSPIRNINTAKIEMKLDGTLVSHTISGSGSVVIVSYTPNRDLSKGGHTVSVSGFDVEDIETCSTSWTFNIREECANIAGNWSGTATCWDEVLRIFFSLSQNGCNVSGTFQSPDSCPALCGLGAGGNMTGSVSGNTFTFTLPQDPLVDCETCELICYGTDYASLTIDGSRMYGIVESEDCELGTFDDVEVDLTRSSSISSIKKLEKKKGIGRSSLLSPKSCSK
jgi:hypothetical protein